METTKTSDINWLDTEVSLYDGVTDIIGEVCTLRRFLFELPLKYKRKIEEIRSCTDAEKQAKMKRALPQATISGVFDGGHSLGNLKRRTSLICMDIDSADNSELDFSEVKRKLSRYSYVMYIGRSVRGKGVFVIIPLLHPERHLEHFLSIEHAFANKGYKVDSACKDVTRLRCLSYEPDPYVNESAAPWEFTRNAGRRETVDFVRFDETDTAAQVSDLVGQIVSRGVNITEHYDEWYRVGCALYSEFGERGRQMFHSVSSVSTKYNPAQCDSQYSQCASNKSITIATFFKYCKDAGLELFRRK